MKPFNFKASCWTFIGVFCLNVFISHKPLWAQVNPVTSVLIPSSANAEGSEPLSSDRYTVRQNGTRTSTSKSSQEKRDSDQRIDPRIEIYNKVTQKTEAGKGTDKSVSVPAVNDKTDNKVNNDPSEKTDLSEKDELEKDSYHPQDNRFNIVEISLAPRVLYMNSSSEYWYRNFHSAGPGIGASANVWLSNNFGIQVSFATTLAADISSDPTTNESALVDHRFTEAGLFYRKHFTNTRKSPSIALGVSQKEYNLALAKSEEDRLSLKSSGLALNLKAKIPESTMNAWVYEISLLPNLKVKESNSTREIKSGTKDTTYGVFVGLGQEYTFDRKNQIFWKLSHRYEKSIYKGTVSEADPVSGSTPQNISVTSGISIFEFGYIWGD